MGASPLHNDTSHGSDASASGKNSTNRIAPQPQRALPAIPPIAAVKAYSSVGLAMANRAGPLSEMPVSRPRSSMHAPTPSIHADLRRPEGEDHPRLDDRFQYSTSLTW